MSLEYDNELVTLINRYVDRLATALEVERLNELLRSNADARQVFARYLNLDSALAEAVAGHQASQQAVKDIVSINQQAIFSKVLAYSISFATCAMLILAGLWWHNSRPAFATIVQQVGNDTSTVGSLIYDKLHRLETGTLELITVHGVRLVIEAPAEFCFESPQRVKLLRGRLSADVPPTAKGFSVITPSGEVIDLGTKFAVDVSSDSEAEVHVFEGEVMACARGSLERRHLTAQSAIRLFSDNTAEACDVRQGTFVRAREMSPLAEALRVGQRERARAASEELQHDSALLAWLDFENPIDGEKIEYGAEVVGARWVQGRFPGTGALDFVNAEDCVQLNLNAELPQFTLMTWIRLNQIEGRINSLYSTDEWGTLGQVHWMIGDKNNLRFAIKGTELNQAGNRNVYLETQARSLTDLERWVHLAIVYDSEREVATHYLNGDAVASAIMPKGLKAALGPAQLGNWKPQEDRLNNPRRRLSGRMDEFAAFSRALDAAEIAKYFRASKPYQ